MTCINKKLFTRGLRIESITAKLAKLVDVVVLGTIPERGAGSSPVFCKNHNIMLLHCKHALAVQKCQRAFMQLR